jgi:hypothetical protein
VSRIAGDRARWRTGRECRGSGVLRFRALPPPAGPDWLVADALGVRAVLVEGTVIRLVVLALLLLAVGAFTLRQESKASGEPV